MYAKQDIVNEFVWCLMGKFPGGALLEGSLVSMGKLMIACAYDGLFHLHEQVA